MTVPLIVLALWSAPNAVADVIDQMSTLANSVFGPSTSPGQSFTPALNGVGFATFSLETGGPSSTLQVNLFNGSGYGGTLLASTPSLSITNAAFQTIRFDFGGNIALTPGNTYTFQIQVLSGSSIFEQEGSPDPYPGGTEFSSTGVAQTNFDLVFSEGTISAVPEPSTSALFSVAALGLLGFRRRLLGARR